MLLKILVCLLILSKNLYFYGLPNNKLNYMIFSSSGLFHETVSHQFLDIWLFLKILNSICFTFYQFFSWFMKFHGYFTQKAATISFPIFYDHQIANLLIGRH